MTRRRRRTIAAIAAGFAGLLSLFNIGGRFFWASLSDKIGRKNTYYTFFILGIVLYALAPTFAAMGSKLLFVLGFGIILSMYGGGFATVPAYLADMFGTQFVGAIHGRLLTAWSTAGIIGPVVVNYIREFQLAAGVPRDQLYNTTMYILCAMLIAGLDLQLPDQAGRFEVAHERGGGRKAAGGERQGRRVGPSRLVRHRNWRARRQGGAVLGLRRHPARLGRLEDAGERGQDILIASSDRGTRSSVPRRSRPSVSINEWTQGDFQCFAPQFASPPRCLSPATLHTASAQTPAAPAARPTQSLRKMKLTDAEAEGHEGQVERQQAAS